MVWWVAGLRSAQCSQTSFARAGCLNQVGWVSDAFENVLPTLFNTDPASNMSMNIGGDLSDWGWAAIASCLRFLGSVLSPNDVLLNTTTISLKPTPLS